MSTSTDSVRITDAESTTQSIVSAVATETGTDPLELEPLYEVFDPDALDALLRSQESGTTSAPVRVEFAYEGCEVCVSATGSVDVTVIGD